MTPHRLATLQVSVTNRFPWMPRLSLLDRYVLLEVLKPFVFGVGVFSVVGVSAGSLFTLLQEVTSAQLPLSIALQVLLLQVPRFFSLSLPMAMLLASLLTMARFAGDFELTALRACGVSLARLVLPVALFGMGVAGLMFGFNQALVPFTQYQSKVLLQRPLNDQSLMLPEKNVFYQEYGPDKEVRRFFYAQTFDGQSMRGLTILDFTQADVNQVIAAESAAWDAQTNRWDFKNGKIYVVNADGTSQNVLFFEDQQLALPQDSLELTVPRQSLEDMSIADARAYQRQMAARGNERKVRKAELHIQQQFALPLVSILFGLIGSALGSRMRGMTSSTGFGLCVLIILGYYFLSFLLDSLGSLNLLSPFSAAWLPDILMGVTAVWLLSRVR